MSPRATTHTLRHATRRGRRSRSGYTMVEVMMAMALLTTGAAGIFALQQAATHGNSEAREMTIATTITRTWLERMKRDALNWNTGANAATPLLLANTRYLLNVPDVGTAPAWATPAVFADSRASYDHWGREVTVGATTRYCAQIRLEWVNVGQAIRTDVRVWWHRRGRVDAAAGDLYANCAAGAEAAVGNDRRVRSVTSSTVVRWVPR